MVFLFKICTLRQYLPRMGWWVIVTIGGWLLGMLLVAIPGWLNWTDTFVTNIDLVFIVFGLTISVGQWSLLRRRLPRASWWIVANLVGWGLLGLVTPRDSVGQFGLFTMGFFPACATGAAIVFLINRVRPAGQREA